MEELFPSTQEHENKALKVGTRAIVFARGVHPIEGDISEDGLWWNDKPKMPVIYQGDQPIYFGPAWTSIQVIENPLTGQSGSNLVK